MDDDTPESLNVVPTVHVKVLTKKGIGVTVPHVRRASNDLVVHSKTAEVACIVRAGVVEGEAKRNVNVSSVFATDQLRSSTGSHPKTCPKLCLRRLDCYEHPGCTRSESVQLATTRHM